MVFFNFQQFNIFFSFYIRFIKNKKKLIYERFFLLIMKL